MGELMDLMFFIGLLLIIIGIALVLLSFVKMIKASAGRYESSGLILIGPIPIVWGTSKRLVAIMGIVTSILILIVILLWITSLMGWST